MAISVREKPRLTHTAEIETPSGRRYRWAEDEPKPETVPSGVRHSSVMPGGFESADCVLPRKPGVDSPDLERLSTLRVRDAGGGIVSETRLERAPQVSGDRMSISPSAVGWQAALGDDKSASIIYVDLELGGWGAASRKFIIDQVALNYQIHQATVAPDSSTGIPAVVTRFDGPWGASSLPQSIALYDAGAGNVVAVVYYDFVMGTQGNLGADPDTNLFINVAPNDDLTGGVSTSDLTAASGSGYYTPATAARYAALNFYYAAAGGTSGFNYEAFWRKLAAYSDHGLTRRGPDPGGFYASDIVAHAVRTWAPLLAFTEGSDGTIRPSSFVIPHLAFKERTTAAEIIRQATRFGLQDWAVWEGPTFWWHERGAVGRKWRARVGPAQLEETGPQADRLWNSIIVQYRDVDGSTRTVGPPGAGGDTEDAILRDDDPENPANQLGIIRRDLLQMGTGTAASATEIGRRFLEETKRLDSSGRARLVGHVEDDRGVVHPYSHVRAGDEISFVDAADTSYRRIVKADHSHSDRACSVDLDSPPEGLQATLERLGVVLVPLGLS